MRSQERDSPACEDCAETNGGGTTASSGSLVTGLLRRLIDLALEDDLLALDAAGLAAAAEDVDVGELAAAWVTRALADDRPASARWLTSDFMHAGDHTTADSLDDNETLAEPIRQLTAICGQPQMRNGVTSD